MKIDKKNKQTVPSSLSRLSRSMCKKVLLAAILSFISSGVFATCPAQQDLDVKTNIEVNGVKAGGNHGFMDVVTISVPESVNSIPFESIQLTYGEVSEYWIPLATKMHNGRIRTSFNGYPEAIKHFEFWVNYSNGKCLLYQTGSIDQAYGKLNQ